MCDKIIPFYHLDSLINILFKSSTLFDGWHYKKFKVSSRDVNLRTSHYHTLTLSIWIRIYMMTVTILDVISILYLYEPMHQIQLMMTSSNETIFRVTGPLCGEFTGPGEFPAQRPVTRSFDVFFDVCPNKRLSKQPWGWWFETPSWSLRRQCSETQQSEHMH